MNKRICVSRCLAVMIFFGGVSICRGEVDVYLPGDQSPCAKAEMWASIGLKFSPDKKWDCTVAAPDPGYEEFGPQVDDKRSIVTTHIAEYKATAKISKIRVDGNTGHYWFLITDGDLLLPSRCLTNKAFYAPKQPWNVNPNSKTIEIQTVLEKAGSDTEVLTTSSSYRVEPGPVKDSVHVFVDGHQDQFIELLPSKVGGSQVLVLILGMPGATFSGGTQGPIKLPSLGQKQAIARCNIALSADKKTLLYKLAEEQ